jgi:ATP-binding cassette subfamily B protein
MNDFLVPRPLWQSVRGLLPYCKSQGSALLRVALLGAASASLAALEPLTLKAIFDRLAAKATVAEALLPFGLFIAIVLLRESLGLFQDRLFWRARLGISFGLLQAMIERLHLLPLAYHRETSVGATMAKIERGMAGVLPRSVISRCTCFQPWSICPYRWS